MVDYWGEIAGLATSVCWSFTALFFTHSARIVGSGAVNRSRLIFAFVFLSLSHFFVEGTLFPTGVEPFRWGWLGVSSILGLVLGDTFLFQAYVLIGPRLAMLLMSTVPIYSTLFGWIFFGESVTAAELAGILMTVGGIGWVVAERQPGRTGVEGKQYKIGVLYGLAGALGQVTNLIAARYGMVGGFSALSATIIRIAVAVIVLWALTFIRGQVLSTLRSCKNRDVLPAIVGGSITGPFAGIWLSLIAIQSARLGIVSTLMALPPILLIPMEFLVYRKPVGLRGMVGTIIALAGVAIILVL